MKAARAKRATPFEGKLNSHGYLQDVALPAYLPRQGLEPVARHVVPTTLELEDRRQREVTLFRLLP